MSLYKDRDCFFISSFLAGKEAKEAGGTYEWFPLDPLSTLDGAKQRGKSTEENPRGRRHDKGIKRGRTGQRAQPAPLDSPCSMGGAERFSSSRSGKSTARTKSKRRQRTERLSGVGSWPETETLAGKGSSYQPVHCRATVNIGWKGLRFSPNFWFEIGGRRCLAKHPFLVRQQCWKGWRRCGERISFLVRRKQERHRAGEKRKRAKNGGSYPGQGERK